MATTTYIALLRGINVGGKRKLPMVDLKKMFVDQGFENVMTYIQSGNVIFQAKNQNTVKLATQLEAEFLKLFALEVPVIIRTASEWQQLIDAQPYQNSTQVTFNNPEKWHVTLLGATPEQQAVEKMNGFSASPDDFRLILNSIYLYCQNGYGNTKLTNTFFESKLKVKATTRNWKTIIHLSTLCEKSSGSH